jgi:hypothetical protein
VFYFAESPFQIGQAPSVLSTTNGGIVTKAVNTVTASGALYFSSSGNSGNLNDTQSGVWEGNFANGGAVGAPIPGSGTLHDFDPGAGDTTFDTVTSNGGPTALFWSDPLGGSANDYDLFVLNSSGSAVVASSTNVQNGTQDPFELTAAAATALNNRIVVVQRTGAAQRYLHVNTNRGRWPLARPGRPAGMPQRSTGSVSRRPRRPRHLAARQTRSDHIRIRSTAATRSSCSARTGRASSSSRPIAPRSPPETSWPAAARSSRSRISRRPMA